MCSASDDRAVSEVLSYVLIFSVMFASITAVSLGGFGALEELRDSEHVDNAERAYDIMAENMADIYQQHAPSRATEISIGTAELFVDDNVTIQVSTDGGSTWTDEVKIRPLVLRIGEDTELVYEAGAIFRSQDQGGTIVKDPPFQFSQDGSTIQIINLDSGNVQSMSGGTVLIRALQEDERISLDESQVSSGSLRVRIENSAHQDLWKEYFEDIGSAFDCPVDDPNTLECTYSPGSDIRQVYVVVHDIRLRLER